MFIYKYKVFQQIDGFVMGSPLGPTTATFFLADLETHLLQQTLYCSPKLYYRYAVEIFTVFDKECTCAQSFLIHSILRMKAFDLLQKNRVVHFHI